MHKNPGAKNTYVGSKVRRSEEVSLAVSFPLTQLNGLKLLVCLINLKKATSHRSRRQIVLKICGTTFYIIIIRGLPPRLSLILVFNSLFQERSWIFPWRDYVDVSRFLSLSNVTYIFWLHRFHSMCKCTKDTISLSL